MTNEQYKVIMEGKDFSKDVHYILAGENTKINSARFEKVELDEANSLLKAYLPEEDEPNFIVAMDFVLGVQFFAKNSSPLFNEINRALLTDY